MKKRIEGFYGGKFLPMHKGHVYCIDVAANVCDHVVVIMFINGEDELKVLQSNPKDETLSVESRIERAKRVCDLYDNVEFRVVDCVNCKLPDGSEDWDADRKSTRLNSSHPTTSRMPSSA